MHIAQTKQSPIKLSNGTTLDPFVKELLLRRGIIGKESIVNFLEPKLKDLPDPFLMKDMDRAVIIAEQAIIKRWKIVIWGDYDVDGTTATALLLKFFKSIDCDATYHIPSRLTDGYGLQKKGLERLDRDSNSSNKLLITVDNGIAAHEAVERASQLGYTTIITDHHTPPLKRIRADAVLNPKQDDCNFPDEDLAGVGVAFYFVMGLRNHLKKNGFFNSTNRIPNLKKFLDLVGIGTVADMVPLQGINRTLVKAGMETLATKTNPGLIALCNKSNLDCSMIRSEDISFQIAPKINATGRLGHAEKAVQLFMAESKKDGLLIANELIKTNEQRKLITIVDLSNAVQKVLSIAAETPNSNVVAGKFHVGVAGIVASNLVEKYKKPSLVLCELDDGVLTGSGRSVAGIDLYEALEECKDVLLGFGGHKMAIGLNLQQNNFQTFRRLFEAAIVSQKKCVTIEASDDVDANIEIENLFKHGLLRQLHLMEPFGEGNPQPIFRDSCTRIVELSSIGKDKNHLRLSFASDGGKKINGIAFGLGALEGECRANQERKITYTPSLNFFKGRRNWQVRVIDIAFANK